MPTTTRGASALVGAVALVMLSVPATAAPTAPHKIKTERVCSAAKTHHAACFAIKQIDPAQPAGLRPNGVTPNVAPSGYGPGDLRSAYALTASGSSTQTVAIVDAYDDPSAESDLGTYRSQYGLPACTTANGCFKKINQNGATSPLPAANTGWAGEISLDVDMVSAICPNCHILLVEATSPSFANLGTAVNRAVASGAKFVSNSYGGSESSNESSIDTSYYNHPGVAMTVSSGDNGYGVEYPAASRYVTAVGGTTLTRNSSSRGWGETAWSGAGSGCSAYETKPAFQSSVPTGCARRAVADVSAVADPNTGVAVYQTYGGSGWAVYGGTSVAAPIIAGVYALAGNPGSSDYPNAYPYSHTANLNDVTSGSNGSCGGTRLCTATAGWDGPTGLGTPNGTAAFKAGTTSTGCSSPGQKLGNPGFESGNTTWSASSGVIGQYGSSGQPTHGGTWDAWLDGYGTTHTDTLSQSVTIPAGCTNSTLSFYLHIDTAETTTTTQYDKFTVQVGSTILGTYSNLNPGSGYTLRSFAVGSYAGSTVTVTFTGTEDNSLQTSFVVDDTALTAS